jgi:hypothetical protein
MSDQEDDYDHFAGDRAAEIDMVRYKGEMDAWFHFINRTKPGEHYLTSCRDVESSEAFAHALCHLARGNSWKTVSWMMNPAIDNAHDKALEFDRCMTNLIMQLVRFSDIPAANPVSKDRVGELLVGDAESKLDVLKMVLKEIPADKYILLILGNAHMLDTDQILVRASGKTFRQSFVDLKVVLNTAWEEGENKKERFGVLYTGVAGIYR